MNDLDGELEALVGLGAVSGESHGYGRDRTVAGLRVAGAEGRDGGGTGSLPSTVWS